MIQEIESEDPIDFADLPFEEETLRALIASRVCDMMLTLDGLSDEDRQISLLATAAKLVLENLVLHLQLLRTGVLPMSDSSAELLRRLRDKK
ncbi:hypothetical protein [Undibacterium sp.]|uniref:hypothetical protein n=1 Tax=Undibacterium sp. TaxID=1914977 RepID=UPI002D80FD43|nr:hypothetical protein [Undibacterium sp.]